jgi:hypothetical protein
MHEIGFCDVIVTPNTSSFYKEKCHEFPAKFVHKLDWLHLSHSRGTPASIYNDAKDGESEGTDVCHHDDRRTFAFICFVSILLDFGIFMCDTLVLGEGQGR